MTHEYFDTLSARSMMKIPHRGKQFLSHVLVSNKNAGGRNQIVSFKRHSLPPVPPTAACGRYFYSFSVPAALFISDCISSAVNSRYSPGKRVSSSTRAATAVRLR